MISARRKALDEYGGVFLADVVGLGKTYMSALLAQQLQRTHASSSRRPQLLEQNNPGSWPNVFRDFAFRRRDFESIGKLERTDSIGTLRSTKTSLSTRVAPIPHGRQRRVTKSLRRFAAASA